MARRLYLGRLPPDSRTEDVAKFFDGCGRIVDCRVMTGFGFVEFENSRDAEDAVHNFNGKAFLGANIVVEFAKESRPRRDVYEADRAPRARRPPGFRLVVSGISRDTSWQDLKDFGREAGSVSYADIDRDKAGEGILEYLNREDAERAVKELDGKDLRGNSVRVTLDTTERAAGADNYRRDDRRDDRREPREERYGGRDDRYGGREERYGRDDRYGRDERYGRDDRYREERYKDDRSRREERAPFVRPERSRSPARRADLDDRRPRSPPHKKDVEERRPAGDERRREEKDDRYEERPPRANGDNGWAR